MTTPRDILRKIRRLEVRTRRRVSDRYAGAYHSVFRGRGMEFDEVREYQPGDDVRDIDWNVTARMGRPFVKKFVEERELTLLLMADLSASTHFGSAVRLKRDLIVELVAVLAFSAVRNNDRVGLLLFSDDVERYLPPRKGASHALRLLRETLAWTPRGTGTRLATALDYLNRVQPRRTVSFLISDFVDGGDPAETDRALAISARRHDLIAVCVRDRLEQAWPAAGVVRWRDAETGLQRLLDTSDARARRALTLTQLEARETLLRRLSARRTDLIELDTARPYDAALERFFRERERRRRT
jgi:uncharacterized protein (DUF58 family)